eukprot:GILI01004428.1.p1 GENE.GILI01004428.1~~GILI01004428.1.p1  ORF type:complete len:726 (-),score=131.14 GILI01004428.1:4-2181(-)
MGKLLTFVTLLAGAYAAKGHTCIHGSPEMQTAFAHATPATVTHYHSFDAQAVDGREPIRVGIDFTNMLSSSKHCPDTTVSRTSLADSSSYQCNANSVFDPTTQGAAVRDHIMPRAKAIIESIYNVTRIASQPVTSGQCGSFVDVSGVSNPIPNIDLQIFVAAGVFPTSMQNTIAYAYPCTYEGGGSSGRPLSAVINFNPLYLKGFDSETAYDGDQLIVTAVHELHHAMGFTATKLSANSQTRSARGKTVNEVTSTNVLAKAKEFYGCDDITGVEIEDEGSSGSVGSHWERRTVYEELMVAAGGAKLSTLTMAFMEDLGFYNVNYSAATPMVVGNNAGCEFVDEKCNTVGGGLNSAWYFDTNYRCSPDHLMVTAYTWQDGQSTAPSYFQYDASKPSYGLPNGFTDRCPYGARLTDYECAWTATSDAGSAIGSYPGVGSRCFETSGLQVDSSSSTIGFNSRCIQARCPFGGTRIEFKLGSTWVSCPIDGSEGSANSPSGYTGTIYCPLPARLCSSDVSTGSSAREEAASGDASLPDSSSVSTITVTAGFNGTQWESVLSDTSRIAIINHLRQDVAYILKTSSANVRARRVTATADGMSVIFGIAEEAYNEGVVSDALGKYVNTGSFLVYTHETYAESSSAAAAEAPYVALTSYSVDQPQSESICSKSMSPEKCVTIIAVVVFAVVCVILLILIYCICLRNPFSEKPRPMASLRYGAGANGGGGKDKL